MQPILSSYFPPYLRLQGHCIYNNTPKSVRHGLDRTLEQITFSLDRKMGQKKEVKPTPGCNCGGGNVKGDKQLKVTTIPPLSKKK